MSEQTSTESARFQSLVQNNLRLRAAIDLALEATYWDRPYDTRINAIRDALHAARGEDAPYRVPSTSEGEGA